MNLEKKVILLKLNTSIFKFPCIDNENVIKVVFIISEYIYIYIYMFGVSVERVER